MELLIKPIGVLHCLQSFPSEAPRQPTYSLSSTGTIELNNHHNFEQALKGLETFTHIWIHFWFHKNSNWSPLIQPPRLNQEKVGLFASRSPHRPNPIGLSCVELIEIQGRKLKIGGHDLLNQTPILDIKPYIPAYDHQPTATNGWLKSESPYQINWSQIATQKALWLEKKAQISIHGFVESQLQYSPENFRLKRIQKLHEDQLLISHRTWRIQFQIHTQLRKIQILNIFSGYSSSEVSNLLEDPYKDKNIHQNFGNDFATPIDLTLQD